MSGSNSDHKDANTIVINNKDKVVKCGPLMVRAMEDIREKVVVLFEKNFGRTPTVTDKDTLEIIGWKYLKRNYGQASVQDIMKILNEQR